MVPGPAGAIFGCWRNALRATSANSYELAAVGDVLAIPAVVIWV